MTLNVIKKIGFTSACHMWNYEYKKDKTNPFFFPQNTEDLPFPFMGLPPLTLATIAVSAF